VGLIHYVSHETHLTEISNCAASSATVYWHCSLTRTINWDCLFFAYPCEPKHDYHNPLFCLILPILTHYCQLIKFLHLLNLRLAMLPLNKLFAITTILDHSVATQPSFFPAMFLASSAYVSTLFKT
jgi:hypothetical protein